MVGMEKWIMTGDTFTGWTGEVSCEVTSDPNECGYFWAKTPDGAVSKWHVNAVALGTVRRPVADSCPDECPRCGHDLKDMGHPEQHAWEGYGMTCPFTWKRVAPQPKFPVNPAEYRPSEQVKLIITMIVESRLTETNSWYDAGQRRFHDGHRHGLNVAFRALVELETRIKDSDDLDQLCGDLIEDAYGSMG